jgi:hypothetical protein
MLIVWSGTFKILRALLNKHQGGKSGWRQHNKVCGSSAVEKDGSCDWNSSFECNIYLDLAKLVATSFAGHDCSSGCNTQILEK